MKMPKHAKYCEYEKSGHDLNTLCTCKTKAHGKPFTHWQTMAQELVMDALVRAMQGCDHRSLPGDMAVERMQQIAQAENPALLERTCEERADWIANLNQFLGSIAGR